MFKPNSILEIGSYHYESTVSMSSAMDTYLKHDEGIIHTLDIKIGGYDGGGKTTNLPTRIVPKYWYPYHTSYDGWKYSDPGIAYKNFINYSNEELLKLNNELLKIDAPKNGYEFIFIDGDHSYEGIKKDWEHIEEIASPDCLIVIDNVWDVRLHEVRKFYDDLSTKKWDFEEWNDENKHLNMVQDTAITLLH